jgi:hypothetical protein
LWKTNGTHHSSEEVPCVAFVDPYAIPAAADGEATEEVPFIPLSGLPPARATEDGGLSPASPTEDALEDPDGYTFVP